MNSKGKIEAENTDKASEDIVKDILRNLDYNSQEGIHYGIPK